MMEEVTTHIQIRNSHCDCEAGVLSDSSTIGRKGELGRGHIVNIGNATNRRRIARTRGNLQALNKINSTTVL